MDRNWKGLAFAGLAWLGLLGSGTSLADSPAQRSAQSDCQREAARRGYVVIGTRNYQQHKDGWSVDLQARDPAGRVSWGSCFVETRSGDVSLFGFGWGGGGSGGSGGNRFEFNCASVEGKYRECQLPVDGRARLVNQKSDAPCVQGRSWGQRGDRVWVDDGCRAKFEVSVGGGGGGGGSGQHVECRSEQQRYRECRIPAGYVGKLVSDDSGGKCRNSGAWGTRDGLIWVNFGCKGRFELVRGGWGGGSGGSGPARAERACLAEAERQGLRVQQQSTPRPISGGFGMQMQVRRGNGPLRSAYCQYWTGSGRAQISD
jgi:hypothetical protein